jgi:hypothetical protein
VISSCFIVSSNDQFLHSIPRPYLFSKRTPSTSVTFAYEAIIFRRGYADYKKNKYKKLKIKNNSQIINSLLNFWLLRLYSQKITTSQILELSDG